MKAVRKENNSVVGYVESPLQLINMLDFVASEEAIVKKIYVRLNGVENNDRRLLNILEEKKVRFKAIRIRRNGLSRVFSACPLILFLFFFSTSRHNLVAGNDRSFVFKAVKIFPWKKIFLVDDGAYSFFSIPKYKQNFPTKITWVTRFKELASEHESVIYLPLVRELITLESHVLVIGAPLSEDGVLTVDQHKKCMSDLVSCVKDKFGYDIFYYPHRNETVDWGYDLPVKMIASEKSVEDYLKDRKGEFPEVIVSFYSTALFILAQIFPDAKYFYFDVRRYEVNENMIPSLGAVYRYLENSEMIEQLSK